MCISLKPIWATHVYECLATSRIIHGANLEIKCRCRHAIYCMCSVLITILCEITSNCINDYFSLCCLLFWWTKDKIDDFDEFGHCSLKIQLTFYPLSFSRFFYYKWVKLVIKLKTEHTLYVYFQTVNWTLLVLYW